ncbi:MAG: hypothetical protein WBM26_09445, partial [Polyangiales bacterium]
MTDHANSRGELGKKNRCLPQGDLSSMVRPLSGQLAMVDKFKGFFLVLLVVLLSAVFALQFGGGQAEGCAAGGSTYLA